MTMLLTPAQIRPRSFESRENLREIRVCVYLFLPVMDAPHVYVRNIGARLLVQSY